ncbi:sigma-54-dependent Fis family transcriptional regulator [candidate division KSB1 bacterium]|nr:sigma-54-dependent Fis family transcriptional regulator [candidate division KSB1 bacterium]
MQYTLFVVDDDPSILKTIRSTFKDSNYDLHTYDSGFSCLDALEKRIPDLVLLDINMRGMDGIEVLKRIKDRNADIIVIIITGYATIESAIEAMKSGAYDYIQKPFTFEQMQRLVSNALATITLKKEVEELRSSLLQKNYFRKIIGESPDMQRVLQKVHQYASSGVNILIEGERGTEKDTVAEYVHYLSDRFARPYVAINCGAIRPDDVEKELFGQTEKYESGQAIVHGAFERAFGGTLFLDEIGELPPEIQLKLADTMMHGIYFINGSAEAKLVDVRLIVATNVPLETEFETGRLRDELFYQLNVARIALPPLRDRKADIIPLANYFIEHFSARLGKKVRRLSPSAETMLKNHMFRGNVWELRNIIERVVLLTTSEHISDKDLMNVGISNKKSTIQLLVNLNEDEDENVILQTIQDIIEKTLQITNQNKSRAAKLLGVPRSTLRHYIHRDL